MSSNPSWDDTEELDESWGTTVAIEADSPEDSEEWKRIVAGGPLPFSPRSPLPIPPQEAVQAPAPYIRPNAIKRRVFEQSIGDPRYADPTLMAATERMGIPNFDPVQSDIQSRAIAEAERIGRTPLVNITPGLEALQDINPAVNLLKRIPAVKEVLGGATESLGEGLSSMTSPEGLTQLPLYAVPGLGQGLMIKGGLEMAEQGAENAVEAIATGDRRLLGRAVGDIAQAGGLVVPGVKGAANIVRPMIRGAEAIARPPALPETAVTDRPINRGETPLTERPNATEKIPTEEGSLGDLPGAETQRATKETSVTDSVQREAQKAEAAAVPKEVTPSPLPKEFTEKPVTETSKLFETTDIDSMMGYKGSTGVGGPTGFAYDVGSMAKTPADVAALKETTLKLQQQRPELLRKFSDAIRSGDEAAQFSIQKELLRSQLSHEAYQAATGVNLSGKLQAVDAIQKVKPGYEPPVPDPVYVAEKAKSQRLAPEPIPGAEKFQQEAATPAAEAARRAVETPRQQPPVVQESLTTEPAAAIESAVPAKAPKWTQATSDSPLTLKEIGEGKQKAGVGEAGFVDVGGIIKEVYEMGKKAAPAVRAGVEALKNIGKEALTLPKTSDMRRSVLQWSGKLQQSFNEAAQAQKEINTKVPDKVRQEGITNWIQAGGDANVLRTRAEGSSSPELKAGYEAALTLTPDELAIANDVKATFDALGERGTTHDVLGNFRENYTPQIWDLGKGPQVSGSRTLRNDFRFSKARTFDSFFDGEQAGFVPKTKEIGKLLPVYMHEMNTVIAARQLVRDMATGKASDGRPLVAARGAEVPVEGAEGKATLVFPKMPKGKETLDYKTMENQPALTGWRWLSEDAQGNPRFIKSDLALHPEALARMKAVLGKSAIREWYQSEGNLVSSIPKSLMRGLDNYQAETKRTMLGFFAPFHQVQEGTHAVGHRVNPTLNVPKIDLVNDVGQIDATKHGLMLAPDRASQSQFMEGFKPSGLVSRIPGIGPLADHYSHYLFHEYIPGLKYKTYQAILERNNGVYAKKLASGEVKPEDIKILSGEQANAAYGHLNYADLGRNPTIQHIMQLGLLAPDFLEARGRFAGQAIKGATGAKVGREQLLALATIAVAQAASAYTAAKLTDGEWEGTRPFEFRKGNRRYTMRSVPEDIATLIDDPRKFSYSRLNPITGRGPVQGLSGVDWRGQKVTAGETAGELLKAPIPLTLRGAAGELPWVGEMLRPNTPLTIPEQLWGAVGIRISRFNPQAEVYKMVDDYKAESGEPKLISQAEQRARAVSPESSYKGLRDALDKDDMKAAREELAKIIPTKGNKKESGYKVINEAMKPFTVDRDGVKHDKTFTGSRDSEKKFVASLTPEQKKIYEQAKEHRRTIYDRFKRLRNWPG